MFGSARNRQESSLKNLDFSDDMNRSVENEQPRITRASSASNRKNMHQKKRLSQSSASPEHNEKLRFRTSQLEKQKHHETPQPNDNLVAAFSRLVSLENI